MPGLEVEERENPLVEDSRTRATDLNFGQNLEGKIVFQSSYDLDYVVCYLQGVWK